MLVLSTLPLVDVLRATHPSTRLGATPRIPMSAWYCSRVLTRTKFGSGQLQPRLRRLCVLDDNIQVIASPRPHPRPPPPPARLKGTFSSTAINIREYSHPHPHSSYFLKLTIMHKSANAFLLVPHLDESVDRCHPLVADILTSLPLSIIQHRQLRCPSTYPGNSGRTHRIWHFSHHAPSCLTLPYASQYSRSLVLQPPALAYLWRDGSMFAL
ncbi:hypothetical protein NLI96_g11655 [Meripilus lineatus]|uniref:Uncharacterized protein n=1 Tax=Meripilus lineatus TaxID=2056292 RepID=A0AAD5UW96_9APHY|nr:hypothetical protein NLI96_g11655 [Physisporinus lineatus]